MSAYELDAIVCIIKAYFQLVTIDFRNGYTTVCSKHLDLALYLPLVPICTENPSYDAMKRPRPSDLDLLNGICAIQPNRF